MADSKRISDLTTTEAITENDLIEESSFVTEGEYASRKASLGSLGLALLNGFNYEALNTTDKKIIGAINELKEMLVVERIQVTTSFNAGSIQINFPLSKAGYTPIGIMGYNLNQRAVGGKVFLTGTEIQGSTAVMFGYSSVSETLNPQVDILWKKN